MPLSENIIFWKNLGKIQTVLLKTDLEFSEFLGINFSQFIKKRKSVAFLPLSCIYECAEKLNFHFKDLMSDDFNIQSILKHSQGTFSLLKRYSVADYSKTRQTVNVLDYIARTRGERAKVNLLRKFQLSEDFILNGNNNVNALLLTDITKYLADTYHLPNSEFLEIGRMTPFTSMNNDIQQELLKKNSIYETLDYFFAELAHRFDKNFSYKIVQIFNEYAIIEARPNGPVIDELEINTYQFGNEYTCMTRMGVISSITWFKFKQFANIEKITSVYQGDKTNLYKFDISPFKKLSNLRHFSGSTLPSNPIYH